MCTGCILSFRIQDAKISYQEDRHSQAEWICTNANPFGFSSVLGYTVETGSSVRVEWCLRGCVLLMLVGMVYIWPMVI